MTKELDSANDTGSPTDLSRRQLGVGLLVVLGGGLGVAKTAEAFPRSAVRHFAVASRLLEPYGLTVDGHLDRSATPAHDVLMTSVVPLLMTEYTQVVGMRNRFGGIQPCIKTSTFEGADEISLFDPSTGGIDPCWLTTRQGELITSTQFHPNPAAGELVPCVKTRLEGHKLATHELFDADQGGINPCWRVTSEMLDGGHIGSIRSTHFHPTRTGEIIPCIKNTIEGHSFASYELLDANAGGIIPCLKVASEMLEGGAIGTVEVTIDDPNLRLSLHVGGKTYNLVDGELVLDERVPS